MRFITKKDFLKCSEDFSKASFLLKGSHRTIMKQDFCLGEKNLIEILMNNHDI